MAPRDSLQLTSLVEKPRGLSKTSPVGTATIRRIEKANSNRTGYVSTLARIQAALEGAGVLFIDDDGTAGIGVRLTKTKKKEEGMIIRRVRTAKAQQRQKLWA